MQLILFLCITGAVLLSTYGSNVTNCGKRLIQHQNDNSNHTADEGAWPWNAAIYHLSEDTKAYKCAGTLIHSSVVLTAARCVFENNRKIIARRVRVELGRHNLNDSGSNVQEFQLQSMENDISIIFLSTEATLNDYVQPICLWQSNLTDLLEVKSELGTVIGWGIKQTTTLQRSDELQQAVIPVITKTNCLNSRADFFSTFLHETTFCAGSRDGTNLCNGDSGESMVFEHKGVFSIRGIVSRGVPKDGQINVCDPHEYFIFTDVVHFIPWIKQVVPELNRTASTNVSVACGLNEEFAVDTYRCEETCEKYGDPLCVAHTPEGRCYCKEGFVRLNAVNMCVSVDNRACRAKMPPTNETCNSRQNERLSEWLHDEPCGNTCENYNVPCNVIPPAGMFYGPHCVCKEGFARLPNGKCVDVDVTECRELWNPTWNPTTPTPTTTTATSDPADDSSHVKYLGCFEDRNCRTLEGHLRWDYDENTVDLCIDFCRFGNFTYAGVQYGIQCFCGNDKPTKKIDESRCDMDCAGNSTQKCGGDWANSVYQTAASTPTPTSGNILGRIKYLGCFEDRSYRTLTGHLTWNFNYNTVDLCIDLCRFGNFKYAGAQHSSECYCGNEISPDLKIDESRCDMNCAGNSTQKCGGDWANSVYDTGVVSSE